MFYPSVAYTRIMGGPLAPGLGGIVWFTDVPGGVDVYVDVNGLPEYRPAGNSGKKLGCGVVQQYGYY